VLDGYNELTVARDVLAQLRTALGSMLSGEMVRDQLTGNGGMTARRFADTNPTAMARIAQVIAASSV
jgi:hypothetical protein